MNNNIFLQNTYDSTIRMHTDSERNYWFYHKDSSPNNEPLLYKTLVSSAKSSIEIFDPYFNLSNVSQPPCDTDMFNSLLPGTTVKILTKKGNVKNSSFLQDVLNAIKLRVLNTQNVRFGMRVFDKGDAGNFGNWFFHDRFLIIDRSDVFLVGSSIGWHLSPQEATGIYKIENENSKQFIISIYEEFWKQAQNNEIPVQYLHP